MTFNTFIAQPSPQSSSRTFHHPTKKLCAISCHPHPPPTSPRQPFIYFLSLRMYLICVSHINRIIQMASYVFLLSLHMDRRFIHMVADTRTSFLFLAEWYSIIWLYHVLCIHLPPAGHLSHFHLLANVKSAAPDICVPALVWIPIFQQNCWAIW